MELYIIDAFTAEKFQGNPAAVCLMAMGNYPLPIALKQSIAQEMNLSETAFPVRKGANRWELTWFTPAGEIDLCGHATLATAHLLFELGLVERDAAIIFETRSGPLKVSKLGDRYAMDFPQIPMEKVETNPQILSKLSEALGFSVSDVTRAGKWLIVLATEAQVRSAEPRFSLLKSIGTGSIAVTAPGSQGFDCVSRVFVPGHGVDEDPVTGSAHCALGPFWGQRLGKRDLKAFQASKRGGTIDLHIDKNDRIFLTGQAVTVLKGTL